MDINIVLVKQVKPKVAQWSLLIGNDVRLRTIMTTRLDYGKIIAGVIRCVTNER